MKRFLAFSQKILLLVITILVLAGCGKKEKIKIGYLYPSEQFPRFIKEGNFITERLRQLGVEPIVMSGEDNDAIQIQNGIKMLDKGVDMLIIAALNGATIAPLVREAHSRGVPVMAYNRLISNVDYDVFFTGNNEEIGRIFCDIALTRKPKGNYVILAGDRFDRNGVELKAAIDTILAPHVASGDINIIYETYIENWNREISAKEIDQVISSFGTDIDVILAGSDPMADGVIETLDKYNMTGKVVLLGQDADIYAVKHILNDKQTGTVYHPYKTLGYKAAELAVDIVNKKNIKSQINATTFNGLVNIPTVQVKSVAITKENVEKELIEVGEYSWDQLND